MPHNLDLQRPGGTLTGSTLNLGLEENPQLAVDLGSELSPEVVASLESSLPGLEGTAQPPQGNFLTKPFSEFTLGDRLKFALKGGLAGAETVMKQRQGAIKAQAAKQKAKLELDAKTLDVTIKSITALEAITDPRKRVKVAELLGNGIAKFDKAAGSKFKELADEPSITELLTNPGMADQLKALGGIAAVIAQFEGSPTERSALFSRVADIHRSFITSKITEMQKQFPEKFKNVDLNDDGTITTGEVLAFTHDLIEDEEIPQELRLSHAEWNVFNFSEFEADVASLFGAQTRATITDRQKGKMVEALDANDNAVFVTQEQLRNPNSGFRPVPKKSLITQTFGGNAKEAKLFASAVERRDELNKNAGVAARQIPLANQMIETSAILATGVGTETISDLKSLGGTIARAFGMSNLSKKIADEGDAQVLRSLNRQAVRGAIQSTPQGSISNFEQKLMIESFSGLGTDTAANIAMGHMYRASSTAVVEHAAFFETIVQEIADGTRKSDVSSSKNYNDYVTDIPRLVGIGEDIRHIDEGPELWRFYLKGRPKKWILPGGEFSLDELKTVAGKQRNSDGSKMSVRQMLGRLNKVGKILGVR